jgi:hypothetical protein
MPGRFFQCAGSSGSATGFGAGTGAFLHKAAVSGWSVTGLEPDEGARKICMDKYGIGAEDPEKLFSLEGAQFQAGSSENIRNRTINRNAV